MSEAKDWEEQDIKAIEAAANELLMAGKFYRWFQAATLDDMDPIGYEEFIAVVDRIVVKFLNHAPRETILRHAHCLSQRS